MNLHINQRTISGLGRPSSGNRVTYDSEIPGFGVRITARGVISYVLNYRVHGRERRFTLGRHPDLSTSAARDEAIQLRGKILHGVDPLASRALDRIAPTVHDLTDRYLKRHAIPHKRPSSVRNDELMIEGIILPRLGRLRLDAVRRRDIEAVHQSLRGTPYRANRVLALLSKMFSLALAWDEVAVNPCKGVQRFPEEKRDRWLQADELKRLAKAVDSHPNRTAANAILLILLTGSRKGEALSAKWEDFDLKLGVWTKPSHHTKQKRVEHVPLSAAAIRLLREMKMQSEGEHLFPGVNVSGPRHDLKSFWEQVRKQAGLERVRIHDLRHTYASHLVSSGFSLPIVGRLLGHTQPQTTARYSHLADKPLRVATNRFSVLYNTGKGRRKK